MSGRGRKRKSDSTAPSSKKARKSRNSIRANDPEAPYLPEELWDHILSYLPTYNILRSSAVSKSWYSLVPQAITEINVLNAPTMIDNTAILSFGRLTRLQRLDLGGCNLDDELGILSKLQNLTHLNLGNIYLEDFSHIAHLKRLRCLDLTHNLITDFSAMSGLTNLSRLVLQYSDRLVNIAPIVALTGLKELNLNFCTRIARSGIASLTKLRQLENLTIQGCSFLAADNILAKFSGLRHLDVASCGLEDSNALTNLTALTSLNLSNNFRVNALLLDRIFALSHLQSLTINNCLFSEAALPHITTLSNLTALEMMQTNVSNKSIASLAQLPRLRRVNLIGTFVSHDKLQQLASKLRVDVATPYFF
jgi:Leucine-rich repeat (LRR) protein